MIPFVFGAFFGGAVILGAVSLVLKTTSDDVYRMDSDFDPWEEEEFWDDYHRNI
jgi:hypothetical protein